VANYTQNKRGPDAGACEGATRFAEFLEQRSLTYESVAGAVGTNRGTVCSWALGKSRPRHEWRLALETFTRGEVPALAWLLDTERAVVEFAAPWDEQGPEEAP